MNAKKELIKHIGNREVKYIRVEYEKSLYSEVEVIEGTLNDVLEKFDFDYDNGFGSQYITGTIWYTNGTWSDRREYDGSEWWEYHTPPQPPTSLNQING